MFQTIFQTILPKVAPEEIKLSIHVPETPHTLANSLSNYFNAALSQNKAVIILCIGSDRSTGDALGPLTGTKLKNICPYPYIFGTLDSPVHATNLSEVVTKINTTFANPYILAIDACLGKSENVGYVTLAPGSLKPGAALKKELPDVGNAHITGIVNVGGFLSEYLVLQCTRLNLVVKMADTIAAGLSLSLYKVPII